MHLKDISRTFRLEVERKFRRLAVSDLTSQIGDPRFQSVQPLRQRTIADAYFDRAGRLAAAGMWVRQRNEQWEAKIKKGGDFQNSRFEELSDPSEIGRRVRDIIGCAGGTRDFFGLDCVAKMQTTRKAWLADGRFTIVLDAMDFGHEVGEVELQMDVRSALTGRALEDYKQRSTQQMDEEIVAFMHRYRWAFAAGAPIGKLTAYFELKAAGKL